MTEVAAVGLVVVTWNVASSCPFGMVIEAGNEAIAALLEEITSPCLIWYGKDRDVTPILCSLGFHYLPCFNDVSIHYIRI